VPTAQLGDGASVKVLAGEIAGVRGPVDPAKTQPIFLDIALAPGASARVPLPQGHNAFAYVYEVRRAVGDEALPAAGSACCRPAMKSPSRQRRRPSDLGRRQAVARAVAKYGRS